MKRVVLLLLAALLVFGCTGGQTTGTKPGGGTTPGTSTQPAEACTPSYAFSEVDDGTLSQTAELVATVTCAAGKSIVVRLDGTEAASATPDSNATTPLKLDFGPKKDGTLKLTVESDGETVYSRDWTVAPLGSDDTKGLENDGVSFKEWRAMSVDVQNTINPGRVKVFMKRIDYRTQPGTNVIIEIRNDDNGAPGNLVASVKRPLNVTTLSENWINFDFDTKPTLSPGTYWIVLRVEQTENVNLVSDTINVHYVAVDKQAEGNDYTSQMLLDVSMVDGTASESEWTPLSYDRIYSIVLTSGK